MYNVKFYKNGYVKSAEVSTKEGHELLMQLVDKVNQPNVTTSDSTLMNLNFEKLIEETSDPVVRPVHEERSIIKMGLPNRQSVDFILRSKETFNSFACPSCGQQMLLIDKASDLVVFFDYPNNSLKILGKIEDLPAQEILQQIIKIQSDILNDSEPFNPLQITENSVKGYHDNAALIHEYYEILLAFSDKEEFAIISVASANDQYGICPFCEEENSYYSWVKTSIDTSAPANSNGCPICLTPTDYVKKGDEQVQACPIDPNYSSRKVDSYETE